MKLFSFILSEVHSSLSYPQTLSLISCLPSYPLIQWIWKQCKPPQPKLNLQHLKCAKNAASNCNYGLSQFFIASRSTYLPSLPPSETSPYYQYVITETRVTGSGANSMPIASPVFCGDTETSHTSCVGEMS